MIVNGYGNISKEIAGTLICCLRLRMENEKTNVQV